jgi:Tol biopolymer transport system component
MRRLVALLMGLAMTLLGLVTIGGPVARATTPGTNGRIVFGADLGLGFQLYTIKPNGTGFHQVTNVLGDAFQPDWSPDGLLIAFEHDYELDGEENGRIGIVNADGSDAHDVTPGGVFAAQPAFTPDGDQLVYECGNCPGGNGIFLMAADGSDFPGLRLSTNPFPDEGDSDPNISPDGQTITFVRHKVDAELQALYAVDIDGTNERRIAPYTLEVAVKHDWAPDGEHIVIGPWADYPDHQSPNVATIAPDGSYLRMLTNYTGGEVGAFAGSYSPDGRWIVFRVENLSRDSFRLFKMRPDGSDRTLIASLPFAPRGSDWGSRPES